MAYKNRKAYKARRGLSKAQDGWWSRAKQWGKENILDPWSDASVNMSNIAGSDPEVKNTRRQMELQSGRAQDANVDRYIDKGADWYDIDQGVLDYISENPDNPQYNRYLDAYAANNPNAGGTFNVAQGESGPSANLDAFGNPIQTAQSTSPGVPYVKRGRQFGRGGLLARGGAVKSSNVLGKGGTPKAKRGGSIGRNGIL